MTVQPTNRRNGPTRSKGSFNSNNVVSKITCLLWRRGRSLLRDHLAIQFKSESSQFYRQITTSSTAPTWTLLELFNDCLVVFGIRSRPVLLGRRWQRWRRSNVSIDNPTHKCYRKLNPNTQHLNAIVSEMGFHGYRKISRLKISTVNLLTISNRGKRDQYFFYRLPP